jgi:predicted CoA-binding protein
MTTLNDMRACLTPGATIAVVGLSPKTHRDSYRVSRYMQAQGYRIVPVNPSASEVLGERCYATLTEAAAHGPIDVVNCFRHPDDIPPIADEAIAIGAKGLWLQLGIENDQAAATARQAGLHVVQNRCIMVEHARLKP